VRGDCQGERVRWSCLSGWLWLRRAGNAVLWSLALVAAARADVQNNVAEPARRYQSIVKRNAFGLVPALSNTPLVVPKPQPQAPSDLKLSGLAASSSRKAAYLMWEERGKPPRYFTLSEGQKEDDLEAVAIDVVAETVRLRQQGMEFLLSLKANGIKSSQQVALENQTFVEDHTRAHVLHQLRERERIERERAAAEAELQARREKALEATLNANGFISGAAAPTNE
jgi:type II secretory pathway component PulC